MTMHIIGMILLRLAIAAIVVGIVMWLWNLVIPGITGWTTINYWKALGLTVLFHLLTAMPMHRHGGQCHHGGHGFCTEQRMSMDERREMRHTMMQLHEKLSDMKPTERKAFLLRMLDDKDGE